MGHSASLNLRFLICKMGTKSPSKDCGEGDAHRRVPETEKAKAAGTVVVHAGISLQFRENKLAKEYPGNSEHSPGGGSPRLLWGLNEKQTR